MLLSEARPVPVASALKDYKKVLKQLKRTKKDSEDYTTLQNQVAYYEDLYGKDNLK